MWGFESEARYITKASKRLSQLYGATSTFGIRGWFLTTRVGKEKTKEGKNLRIRKGLKDTKRIYK